MGRAWMIPLAYAVLTTGCTAGFIPASEAVKVTVENRSAWNVTVRAVHHVDLVDFRERVPRGEERTFRVSHRAFGPGPVAFEILAGRGRLGARYRGNGELRVPPGSSVVIVVRKDLRASTVRVGSVPSLAVEGG